MRVVPHRRARAITAIWRPQKAAEIGEHPGA
jgi:hypothetical protein